MTKYFWWMIIFFLGVNITMANPLQDNTPQFDAKKANQQFDALNLKVSVQNLNKEVLLQSIDQLSGLIANADRCMDATQKRLTNISSLIDQGTTENKQAVDLIYLQKEQKDLSKKQAECRLFSIRAKDAVEIYKNIAAKLRQKETLTKGLPLWGLFSKLSTTPPEIDLDNLPSWTVPKLLTSPFFWLITLSLAWLFATFAIHKLQQSRTAKKHLIVKQLGRWHIFLLATGITMLTIACCFAVSAPLNNEVNALGTLANLINLYVLLMIAIVFIFKLRSVRAFFYWYSLNEDFFQSFLKALLTLYLFALFKTPLDNTLELNETFAQLNQSIFLLTVLGTSIYYLYAFCHAHRHIYFVKKYRRLITTIGTALLIAYGLLDIFGYHNLASATTNSSFLTLAILFVTILINHGIQRVYLILSHNNQVIKLFGYRNTQTFIEILILRTVLQCAVILLAIYLIGISWEILTFSTQQVYGQIINGIQLASITVHPTRIATGLVVFCGLYLIFRAISTQLSRHQQFEDEEETQVAIASILTYIGFALAAISGLLTAGFNFTGLAIIAGALSVGIGLGLQSIVNNFVSGIILLIEKPIKPGDRILVDGMEGFVKKIRVRSTRLYTPAREDVIIPNSDLITKTVVNYTFSDEHLQIISRIGVAYGSDTALVSQLLLEIAHSHPEVIKTSRQKPTVLLKAFGDSALNFELVCLIRDVNKKSTVLSDLNLAIERVFRENNVSMPYPQRDIHLISK